MKEKEFCIIGINRKTIFFRTVFVAVFNGLLYFSMAYVNYHYLGNSTIILLALTVLWIFGWPVGLIFKKANKQTFTDKKMAIKFIEEFFAK